MNQDALWDFMQVEAAESFGGAGPRVGWLVRQLRRGDRVLNIGVGDGGFERLAIARDLRVYSLDPSERTIERLNRRFAGRVSGRAGRAEAIPWEAGTFHAVVMTEVLEHIGDDSLDPVLHEVARVLAPNGVFIGTVPAHEDLTLNTTVCPQCGHKFHRWGHVRSFSAPMLRQTLAPCFREVSVEEHFFSPWDDLAPRHLLDELARRARHPSQPPARPLRVWVRENWRALLSSAPRLAARRLGAQFANTHWAFRASSPNDQTLRNGDVEAHAAGPVEARDTNAGSRLDSTRSPR